MFGNDLVKGRKGTNNIFKYMMLSQMMKGDGNGTGAATASNSGMSAMLPLMMMGGNMGDMFDGMFNFDEECMDEDEDVEEEE